jgi:dihydrofolate reductase
MRINLIVAHARNRAIGLHGAIPWRIPGEQAYFRRVTMGHPIVMGRKTWESIGRPLPGRRNIVVTRRDGYAAAGADTVSSLDAALALCVDAAEVFVIGGAELYALALPRAARVFATEIDADYAGDAFFPPLPGPWRETLRTHADGPPPHDYVVYERSTSP